MTEAATAPDMTLVRMRHPEIQHGDQPLPITTVHAFKAIHEGKGWELVDEPVAGTDLEFMTKDEIRDQYPAAAALPVSATKAELIAAARPSQEG